MDEICDGQSEPLQHEIDARPNPEDICRTNEIQEIMAEEMRRLPPGLAKALQLFVFEGLSTADSSQALGIGRRAFKSRVIRARQKLTKRLQFYKADPAYGSG